MADLYSWEEGVFSMTYLSVIVSHFPVDGKKLFLCIYRVFIKYCFF